MLKKHSTFDVNSLVRKNILNMKPYSSARDEFKGSADVYLDANENPNSTPYNRYPDPLQIAVKEEIAKLKDVPSQQIFLGNGSDEAIDLLIRAFCEPTIESILIVEPTYGMYSVCAEINNVIIQRVLLTENFDIDTEVILSDVNPTTKLIFLCSPNNPSGNLLSRGKIETILNSFNGLVIIDEAYIDFAKSKTFTGDLKNYPNLVVLQTFSKAWGLAGLRLGMCYASEEIISILNKIKYPYNINIQTQQLALEALGRNEQKDKWVGEIIVEREKLIKELSTLKIVQTIFPSDSNFLLVRVKDANYTYETLMNKGIIVRNRSNVKLCKDCLRITVGTSEENVKLIQALQAL
jgi:histidinol-phosphate aminotransferase